jgi:ABC-type uncharacterized transport system involved in gliding motility auxiliary subunit
VKVKIENIRKKKSKIKKIKHEYASVNYDFINILLVPALAAAVAASHPACPPPITTTSAS